MEVKSAYSTKELAGLLSMAKTNVLNRARRESWQSLPRVGRGGGHEWLLYSMPTETRSIITSAIEQENSTPAPRINPEWMYISIGCALYMLGTLVLCLFCFFVGVHYGS